MKDIAQVPAISVIIPVYNMSAYLRECMTCVLGQSLKNIEVICINDGSSDDSLSILHEYAEMDARVKVISRSNRGTAYSRNEGITSAIGEFISFMDPDDMYPDKDTLQMLYNKAIENHALICGGEMAYFTPSNQQLKCDFPSSQNYAHNREGMVEYRDYQFDYGFTRFIYNREMIVGKNIFFPLYARYEDPPFFVKAMIEAQRFYAIKKVTYAYRISHKKVLWDAEKTRDVYRGFKDVWRMAKDHKLHRLIESTYNHIKDNMYRTRSTMRKEHFRFAAEVEDSVYFAHTSWVKKLCSKRRSGIDNSVRVVTFCGINFRYRK